MTAGKAATVQQWVNHEATVRRASLAAVLIGLVLVSAFGVILSSHNCRELYARLQVLEASQWYLQEEYGRLLLEHSTWASHHRVEQVATRELGMQPPAVSALKLVTP